MTKPRATRKRAPAPPAKAKRKPGRPRKPRHLADYAAVGKPPTDPLRATEWGLGLLTVMLEKVRTDPDMREEQRRAELKSLIRHMKDLVPLARISAAERVIIEADARRSAPASLAVGSEDLEDAAELDRPPLAAGPRPGR